MIHSIGAMHAALRAKPRRQKTQNRSPTKEAATRPQSPPTEEPQRRKG
jgi:hypothetical protein